MLNKSFKFFVLFCLCIHLTLSNNYAQSIAKEEEKLVKEYDNVVNTENLDQQNSYLEKFETHFSNFIEKNPATLKIPFNKLTKNYSFSISTSSDGLFRIYSWDNYTGGTMRFFNNTLQWSSHNKVFSKNLELEEGDPGGFCTQIYDVRINGVKYYLAISTSIGSTKDRMETIKAYKIQNNQLFDTVQLFKTQHELLNSIDVEYDALKNERRFLITYNEKLKEVYIPIVNEKETITKKNLVYKLKGNYFEYVGIQ